MFCGPTLRPFPLLSHYPIIYDLAFSTSFSNQELSMKDFCSSTNSRKVNVLKAHRQTVPQWLQAEKVKSVYGALVAGDIAPTVVA